MSLKKILIAWVPVIMWASLIFTLSNFPTGSASKVVMTDFFVKKSAHMVEYGILSILIYRALNIVEFKNMEIGFTAVLLAMLYGISDEVHQSLIPGRTPRPYDVLFDTIGASLAIFILWNILAILPERPKRLLKKLGIS